MGKLRGPTRRYIFRRLRGRHISRPPVCGAPQRQTAAGVRRAIIFADCRRRDLCGPHRFTATARPRTPFRFGPLDRSLRSDGAAKILTTFVATRESISAGSLPIVPRRSGRPVDLLVSFPSQTRHGARKSCAGPGALRHRTPPCNTGICGPRGHLGAQRRCTS